MTLILTTHPPEATLIPLSLITIGAAGLSYTLTGLKVRHPDWLAPVLLWLGGLGLLAALWIRSVVAGFLALSNMYESVLAVSTGMTLSLAVLDSWRSRRLPNPWVGAVAVWSVLGLIAFGLTLPQDIAPLQAALRSYWRAIHVPIILLSYSLFSLNFATTLVLLIRRGMKQPDQPALAEFAGICASLGFPLVTIGVILGAIWANEAWGTYWNWDPKESMALATLLGYGVYLHLKLSTDTAQPVLDWVALGAFGLLLVTYFGVNLMGVGLHSYGGF